MEKDLAFLVEYLSPTTLAYDLGRWAGTDSLVEFVDQYALFWGRDDLGGYGSLIGGWLMQTCDDLLNPEEVAALGEAGPRLKDRDQLWAEFEELSDVMGMENLLMKLCEWVGPKSLQAFIVKTLGDYEVRER